METDDKQITEQKWKARANPEFLGKYPAVCDVLERRVEDSLFCLWAMDEKKFWNVLKEELNFINEIQALLGKQLLTREDVQKYRETQT
ncbi:MAG: hypothetical protein V1809_08815 [Planctomycetota bacterium]